MNFNFELDLIEITILLIAIFNQKKQSKRIEKLEKTLIDINKPKHEQN